MRSSAPPISILAIVFLLVPGDLSAKGQLTPNQQAAPVSSSTTTAGGTATAAQQATATSICDGVTAAQCRDPAYAVTSCGRYHTSRAMAGTSTCAPLCAAPTLQQCGDDKYLRSVCGAIEARKMMMVPADDAVPDSTVAGACPTTSSRCVNLLCTTLAQAQQSQGSVVAGATTRKVVVPTFVDANLGDDTSDLISVQNSGYADVTALATRKALDPTFKTWRFDRGSSHWWGDRLANHVAFLPSTSTVSAMGTAGLAFNAQRNQKAQERVRWDQNGNSVDECREYVYEKYYDYSRYEDAAFVAGADYRKIYTVAFGPVETRSSIGTRIIAGRGLQQRDASATPVSLHFASNVPRNVFFSYTMVGADRWRDAVQEWNGNNHIYDVDFQGTTFRLELDRPLFIDVRQSGAVSIINGFPFVPLDGPLFGELQNRDLHTESMQFHKSKSDAMASAGIPDEVLFIYDRLKDEFARMMQQRADIEAELRELGLLALDVEVSGFRFEEKVFDPTIVEHGWQELYTPYDNVLDAQRVRSELFDQQAGHASTTIRQFGSVRAGRVTQNAVVGQGQQRTTAGATTTTTGGAVGSSMAGGLRGQSAGAQQLGDRTPTPTSPTTTGPTRTGGAGGINQFRLRFVTLLESLVALDAKMEAALLYADELGCIDPDKSPFSTSPCDWSPRDFAEMMQDQLVTMRELELDRCERFTGGDFDSMSLRQEVIGRFNPVVDSDDRGDTDVVFWPEGTTLVCDDPPYNASPNQLDRYPGCRDAWRVALMKNIARYYDKLEDLMKGAKDMIDPVSGDIRPHEEVGDSDGFGDSTFGAGYDYRAGWSMELPSAANASNAGAACDMRPTAHATFDVTARIFGEEAELVSAGIEAGVGPSATNRATVQILDAELIDVGGTGSVNAATYNILFEASEFDFDEYFHAGATFMIGPVPVTVSAGAAGVISASVSGAGGSLAGGNGCTNGDLGLEMMFAPGYGISGFASAGVDALIVEVGVKIELTIINLSFPLRVGLNLDHSGSGNAATWKMQLTNDLDIVLAILGGRVAGYVEVCFLLCEEFDVTIFRWAPTKLKANLFHSAIDLDMQTLLKAQNMLPITIPGAR